ncbi:hypothetical protein BN14_05107 [Rhizoctonia solani AG-1 IB]|uniref:Uncharacterized protein n=1 Tax=Thanatephorus cucumeris (strain AG1-IB / isolate 7/3/14) TaxID=1108050 RepID=M5BTM6_THACB|nr:hypothetical protein BN14_05107 [Rhizoctonia solani AG-1 IB]
MSHTHITEDSYNLTEETRAAALALLKKLATQYPGATAPKRLSLDVALGDEFKTLAEAYIWIGLQRGVPSLFVDIKSLYKNDEKRAIVEELVEAFLPKLKPEHELKETKPATNGETTPEPPTTYLWALYFLGQHYSYCGNQEKALSLLDTAIGHTPTLPELYTARGRALKRAGDFVGASLAVEAGRLLDGQDRWLNGKSAKYAMRTGRVEDAQNLLGLFTRIFEDIWDDQYDFHSYCIRKYTLSIYTDTIHWEDRVKEHSAYRKAAVEAAKIYIRLHDDPSLVAACTPKLTAEEKKAKAKAVKAASKEPKKSE